MNNGLLILIAFMAAWISCQVFQMSYLDSLIYSICITVAIGIVCGLHTKLWNKIKDK
jgi:hypothetical protein